MRTIKKILLLLALCIFGTSHGQFWKKLTKKAQQAAEETVERKVAEKTARETEKTFDTVFNNEGKLFKKKEAPKLERYTFTHQYMMEVVSDQNTTDITYYLTNEAEYMGSSFTTGKNEEFITVMDLPNSAIHTFIDMGDQKSVTSFKIDLEDVADSGLDANEFTIDATGKTKKIIGYQCEEYLVTGPQVSGRVWVTQEADISFEKAFTQLKSKKMKQSKGIDQSWVSMVDGIALEMHMTDYTRKKNKKVSMLCTNLSESDFSIVTAEYENPF